MSNIIFLACDHGAYEAKEQIKKYLMDNYKLYTVEDLGTYSQESCNYAEYAMALAKRVGRAEGRGILLCGSGIGASMAANRFQGVRAALCRTVEEAKLSREHNDSNVLTLGGRITPFEQMKAMIDVWFETDFEQGRHIDRIASFNMKGENCEN